MLAKPGAYIRDPVLWQWQDDKGNWHTYGYNDCRVIEAAHVAGKNFNPFNAKNIFWRALFMEKVEIKIFEHFIFQKILRKFQNYHF